MDDGTVVDALRRVVSERRDEACALVDARLAVEILAGAGLLDELRADLEPAAIRERLLKAAAGCVERLAGDGGLPLFRPDAMLSGYAALRLAATDADHDDELLAAVFDDKPLALINPTGAWNAFIRPLLKDAKEWAEDGAIAAEMAKGLAHDLWNQQGLRISIVESELRANERLRAVFVRGEGPLLLIVTQLCRARGRDRLHAAVAVVGGDRQLISDKAKRLLAQVASPLATYRALYVDTRCGVAATTHRPLRAALARGGARRWRPIGVPCPIGPVELRRLLLDSPVYIPSDASPWQLAVCVGADRVSWLEDFPFDGVPRLVVFAWHGSDRPIAVTEHEIACMPALTNTPAVAPVPPVPDLERTALLRLQIVREGWVEPESYVDRLTAEQVDRIAVAERIITAWLDDGSVLIGTSEPDQEVVDRNGTPTKPTHVPLNGLAVPRGSGTKPIL